MYRLDQRMLTYFIVSSVKNVAQLHDGRVAAAPHWLASLVLAEHP